MEPETHELLDDYLGDCACYSHSEDGMEADIDGEWIRWEDAKANVLRALEREVEDG